MRLAAFLCCALAAVDAHAYEGGHFEKQPASQPVHVPVLTKAPAVVDFKAAEYPPSERGRGTVAVLLLLDLDARGHVTRAEAAPANTVAGEFLAAAQAAALGIVFSPAEVDGKPSPIRLEFRYVFSENIATTQPASAPAVTTYGTAVLKGDVREAGTRLRLEGVAIRYESGSFAVDGITDLQGKFSLKDLPSGEGTLIISSLKHRARRLKQTLAENEETSVKVYLQREVLNPFETVVLGKRDQKEVTKRVISREELAKVPGSFGDPLRAIQNLPSVARAPLLGGNLVIRGASPNSSEVYIDGMHLSGLYHFGQGPSVLPDRMIEDISFYPCCFSARYGRATAGIVEVRSRTPDVRKWSGKATADLGIASLFLEVPITEKLVIQAAARRSYYDAILPLVLNAANPPVPGQVRNPTIAPVFWDYQLRVLYDHDRLGDFSLFIFGSDDRLKFVQEPTQQTGTFNPADLQITLSFHTLQPRWVFKPAPGITNTLTLQGTYEINTANTPDVFFGMGDWYASARDEIVAKLSPNVTLTAGTDFQWDQDQLKTRLPDVGLAVPRLPTFPGPGQKAPPLTDYTVNQGILEWGFYGELELKFGKLRVIPGMRGEEIMYAGRMRQAFMPRLSVRYRITDDFEVKAATGLFQKRPEKLNILEQFGNPDLELQSAYQSTVGMEWQITPALSLETSAFFNYIWNEAASTSRYLVTPDLQVKPLIYDNRQIGRVYGGELLLRHKPYKNFFGWVAYTLSRSERNTGDNWFLFNFDQTHILIIVGSYILPYGFQVGARFRLVSGNPTTGVVGSVYDTDTANYRRVSGPFRGDRLPTFHQLDIRIDKSFVFSMFTLTIYLDVQNVYNHANAEFSQFSYDFSKQQFFTGLPILPVLGLMGEW